MATEGKKQKSVSALYEDRAQAGKKKLSARGRASSEEEEENPCIASLRRHNPPPRPLPPGVAAAGGATGREKSSSRQASTPEEDIDDGEEENPENGKEDEEYIYAPDQNDEDDDNNYDHDDDMSEEGADGEEKESIDISSGEDESRVKGKKKDGTACMATLISNLRETVKYFKKSTSRLHKFVEICRGLALNIGAHLTLDVCTRWSSTYKMIATGKPYREALKDYAKSDLNYKWEPTSNEWKLYELIEPMLYAFAQVTTAFSAQNYPTANIFYRHIVSIKIALRKAIAHKDPTYKAMGTAMMDKFNKYWEEKNNVMVLATILDPRYKMFYIDWAFKQLYEEHTALDELADVHVELEELYEKFDTANRMAENSTTSTSNICITSISMPASDSDFHAHRRSTTTKSSKSELRNYLEDALEEPTPNFNLLEWWKVNSLRYPVLAKLARRFLTIPASSVSSESTFSTGGRVLDDYRSSLKPAMVEALVCGASYIKGSHNDLNVLEKEVDEEENVEIIKLPKAVLNNNY